MGKQSITEPRRRRFASHVAASRQSGTGGFASRVTIKHLYFPQE
jgi:hypothetical protein